MGNEMGNNNTSAIKEEDNISEGDKNNLLEDTSEHANVITQDVDADGVKEENQDIQTSLAKDAMEKSSGDFNGITIKLGNDTSKEYGDADDVKGEIQTITAAEAKDTKDQATLFASRNTISMLPNNDSLEADTHPSDKNMENQMHPTTESEDVQELSIGMASEDTTIELGEVSLQEESLEEDVKEEVQKILTADAKDVEEKATGFISNNTESMIESECEMSMENQVHPIAELEADHTRSSLENELFKGKDNQEISELEGKPQEGKQDGDIKISITNGIDLQAKSTILVPDDALNLTKSFDGKGKEMNGVKQSEKSPVAGSFESENCETLSSSSLEGTEECRKQEDSTENHNLNDEYSIKHEDEEETKVLTSSAVTKSNHGELVKSEHSLQGTESLLLDAGSHFQQIKEGVLEKDTESKEKLSCANQPDKRDENEFEKALIDTSEAISDPSTIGNNSNNGNLLTHVNHTTEDSLNLFPETFVMGNQLKSEQEENCTVLNEEENKLRKCESKDYRPDQCIKETKEYKSDIVNNTFDMTIGSNGDCNGEIHTIVDSSVIDIAESEELEEPKVTENGLQFDAYVNNSNKASDESNAVPEKNHSVVPEAEAVSLIAESTDVDWRHGKGENHNNSFEDTNENQEASYAMVKTFEETINQEKYFSLQNSTSVKQTNESKYFDVTVENHGFSKLTVPSLDFVDEEAIEKESEKHSQQAEATSEATISTETCSNNSILANGGYETRLSIESNSDNPNISCRIQKSPSFNLDLRIEARKEESDHTPLLYQDKSANESLSKQTGINISNSMLHNVEMPVEEKIVTMERSYSEISKGKASFTGNLKDEEVSSTSPEGKERRKSRSYFFSSCMCCATMTN